MIRLFLKLYGVLIATLVLSFVLQMQLMEYVWRETGSRFDFRVRFVPTFHLIEEALGAVPEASGRALPASSRQASACPRAWSRATASRSGLVSSPSRSRCSSAAASCRSTGKAAASRW